VDAAAGPFCRLNRAFYGTPGRLAFRLLTGCGMTKKSEGINRWSPLFPPKVKLIRTGEICENCGYYGNLFTLKLPDGRLAEFHRRELDFGRSRRAELRLHPPSRAKW
jgi:hypothetical protein